MATGAPEAAVDPVLADELAAIERLHHTGIIDLDERRTQRKEALDAWRLRHQAARFPPGLTDSPVATALLIPLAPALATPTDAAAEAELAAPTKAGGAGRAQPRERSPSPSRRREALALALALAGGGLERVQSAQCTLVDDHPTPPAYAGAPSDATVQSSCCVVCGVPLAAPMRGEARACEARLSEKCRVSACRCMPGTPGWRSPDSWRAEPLLHQPPCSPPDC